MTFFDTSKVESINDNFEFKAVSEEVHDGVVYGSGFIVEKTRNLIQLTWVDEYILGSLATESRV
jgi:hypothetical protein